MLRLNTLGGLVLQQDGQLHTGPASQRRRLALLAVVAAAGARGVSRDKLLTLLWPESEAEAARHSLYQAVHAIRRSAESFGVVVRTGAPVERVLTSGGRVTGVALVDGEEMATDTVVSAVHPHIGFLRHLHADELPDDFVTAIRRWRSRSGTVKINLALSELPDFSSHPGTHLQPHHTGAIELAHSLEYLEQAFQDARSGMPASSRAATSPSLSRRIVPRTSTVSPRRKRTVPCIS